MDVSEGVFLLRVSGLAAGLGVAQSPRAMPWADLFGPVGARSKTKTSRLSRWVVMDFRSLRVGPTLTRPSAPPRKFRKNSETFPRRLPDREIDGAHSR